MRFSFTIAAIASVVLVTGCQKAADPTGSWKGTVDAPASLRPFQAADSAFQLDLQKDHTFTLGGSSGFGGTWTSGSDTVSLTFKRLLGKDIAEVEKGIAAQYGEEAARKTYSVFDKPLDYKLTSDGKTLSGNLPGTSTQVGIPIKFTKQTPTSP